MVVPPNLLRNTTNSAAVTIGDLIREFESPVETLDDLFQPAIFSGYRIIIRGEMGSGLKYPII